MFNLQWTCWLNSGRKWYIKTGCATRLTLIWGEREVFREQFSLGISLNELMNPFVQSRRNPITRSDIMQHNKSSVSSRSVKACWHREWLKPVGPYGEKECVKKPPCLPTREVCGKILDCKYISYPLNPSIEMPCRKYEWCWAYQGVLWREVMHVALTHLGTAWTCLHWPGCAGVPPQGALTQTATNKMNHYTGIHCPTLEF